MISKIFYLLLLSLLIIFLFQYIYPTEPTLVPYQIRVNVSLNLESQTHKSITLNILVESDKPNRQVKLWRKNNSTDSLVAKYGVTTEDTTIIDDNNGSGLKINNEYIVPH